jgi:hypothetical protein
MAFEPTRAAVDGTGWSAAVAGLVTGLQSQIARDLAGVLRGVLADKPDQDVPPAMSFGGDCRVGRPVPGPAGDPRATRPGSRPSYGIVGCCAAPPR